MGPMKLRWGSADGMAIRDRGVELHIRQCSVLAAGPLPAFFSGGLAGAQPGGGPGPYPCILDPGSYGAAF